MVQECELQEHNRLQIYRLYSTKRRRKQIVGCRRLCTHTHSENDHTLTHDHALSTTAAEPKWQAKAQEA